MPPPPQILVGRFRIDATVGKGGMGAVYAATDLNLGRQVAIKMLHPELARDAEALERFREEAMSLGALHHPNIVQLFDFHASDPAATFLVMDLVSGDTLHEVLRRAGSLPMPVAVDYAQQILSALAAAHQKGIVHRDIKPANLIVVSLPARRDLVKVLDFGIAKLTETTIRRRPTTAGVLLGTPLWMAPEQTGGGSVDARADVYSVGLVLFRMITGTNPFEGYDMATTLDRVARFVPPDVRTLRPDTPPHIAAAVARALSKRPEERFASAVELYEALGVGELTARAASLPPGAGTPEWSGATQKPATAPTTIQEKRSGTGVLIAAVAAVGVVILAAGGAVAWWATRSTSPAGAAIVDAGAPPTEAAAPAAAPTPSTSASVAPSASATPPRSTRLPAPVASAAPASLTKPGPLGGNCRCLPDKGSLRHGNNQRLAPRPMTPECACTFSNMTLCLDPVVPCGNKPNCETKCARHFTNSLTFGGACRGFDSTGAGHDSTVSDCHYPVAACDVFAGPAGRVCKGLDHTGALLDGHVFCQ